MKTISILIPTYNEEQNIAPFVYRAKELFREKPDSFIKDVAAMVGYEDQFYFSRLFRSYTGKSPSEFLKEIADEEESIDLLS